MDSFESIVKTIFEGNGYWVKTSFKVELTKIEKVKIHRPTTPRWELDVVAYKGGSNELLVIECKSFLDSTGVTFNSLKNGKGKERYKLFNEDDTREVVFGRLLEQLKKSGSCSEDTTVKLCLATGKVASSEDRDNLCKYFKSKKWNFYSDEWIKNELVKLANTKYDNEVAKVTAKILSR